MISIEASTGVRLLTPALLAAGSTFLVMWWFIGSTWGRRLLDFPGGRKRHAEPVPRLGGVSILVGLLVGLASTRVLGASRPVAAGSTEIFIAVGLVALFLFLIGLADDLVSLSPLLKLSTQFVAAWVVVATGLSTHEGLISGGPLLQLAVPLLGVAWIVSVINAVNLIDGLDGLATGVVAIVGVAFLGLSLHRGEVGIAIAWSIVVGACAGLLPHNWHPARVFLGDSGTLLLGFLVGSLSLHTISFSEGAVSPIVPLLVLGVPIIDTILVAVGRFREAPTHRLGHRLSRILQGDRSHLHHAVESLVEAPPGRVAVLYGLVVASCGLAALVFHSRSLALGCLFLALQTGIVLALRRRGFALRRYEAQPAPALPREAAD